MTAHDPLCREDTRLTMGDQTLCDCALIARVIQREYDLHVSADLAREEAIRADEREKWLKSDHLERALEQARADERERRGNNCRGMWDEWVHDLRAQVEALLAKAPRRRMAALTYETGRIDGRRAALSDVLALLGGESDE